MRIKFSHGFIFLLLMVTIVNMTFLWNQHIPAVIDQEPSLMSSRASTIECNCMKMDHKVYNATLPSTVLSKQYATLIRSDKNVSNKHNLAVVVPFRNRYEEMMEFVPHIHNFLLRQNVNHHIWIINQVDTHRSKPQC